MLKGYQRLTNNLVGFVNSRDKIDRKTRDALASRQQRESVLATARLIHQSGLVAGSLGELSLRLSGNQMLFLAGVLFSQIEDQHLAITAISTAHESASHRLPVNLAYHQAVYARTQAQAVLYCQPTAVLAVLARGIRLQPAWMLQAHKVVGTVDQVSAQSDISIQLDAHGALLIEGKGLLTWGEDLPQVLDRAEVMERWCQVALAVADST